MEILQQVQESLLKQSVVSTVKGNKLTIQSTQEIFTVQTTAIVKTPKKILAESQICRREESSKDNITLKSDLVFTNVESLAGSVLAIHQLALDYARAFPLPKGTALS